MGLLVVTHYRITDDMSQAFREEARLALTTMSERAGFVRGHLGRATDEAARWVLSTEWEGVGAYRRALSSYDVKLHVTGVMLRALEEPSAFEVLESTSGSGLRSAESDRAADAATAGPGGAPGSA